MIRYAAIFFIIALSFLRPIAAEADGFAKGATVAGRVVGVLDGDTLSMLVAGNRNIRVRLAEIDAPEKSQAFGQVSRKSLSDLVYGKSVNVQVIDTDRYGRTVGRVFIGELDVNLTQVQKGLAWAYERYVTDPKIPAAEKDARARKLGLWADPAPTPPWLFRRGGNSSAVSLSPANLDSAVRNLHTAISTVVTASKAMRVKS